MYGRRNNQLARRNNRERSLCEKCPRETDTNALDSPEIMYAYIYYLNGIQHVYYNTPENNGVRLLRRDRHKATTSLPSTCTRLLASVEYPYSRSRGHSPGLGESNDTVASGCLLRKNPSTSLETTVVDRYCAYWERDERQMLSEGRYGLFDVNVTKA